MKKFLLALMYSFLFFNVYGQERVKTQIVPCGAVCNQQSDDYYWYYCCDDKILGEVGSYYPEDPVRGCISISKERCMQLSGMKIEEVSIGINPDINTSYKLIIADDFLSTDYLYEQKLVPEKTDAMQWVTVKLDEPFVISGETELFIGCECTPSASTQNAPCIGVDMVKADMRDNISAFGIYYNGWSEMENYEYNLSIKVGISGETLPVNDLAVFNCEFPSYVFKDNPFDISVVVKNQGMETISSLTMTYEYGGVSNEVEIDNLNIAPLRLYNIPLSDLCFTAEGSELFKVSVSESGKDDFTPEDNMKDFSVPVYPEGVERCVLVDEMIYDTGTDLTSFNRQIADSLKSRNISDKVIWVQHHRNDEFTIKADKTHFFYDPDLNEFYPAFMVDHMNFSDMGATMPGSGSSVPATTPMFEYKDSDLFRFIQKRIDEPAFLSCSFNNTGTVENGDNKVYNYKMVIEQIGKETLSELRYVMMLIEDGKTDGKGSAWDGVPVEFYGSYKDSWGDDLTLKDVPYESDEFSVEVPAGLEGKYKLVGFVYTLSDDRNQMNILNATYCSLPNSGSSISNPDADGEVFVYADGKHIAVYPGEGTVEVYNVSGKLEYEGECTRLDSFAFAPGMYVVKLNSNSSLYCFKVRVGL